MLTTGASRGRRFHEIMGSRATFWQLVGGGIASLLVGGLLGSPRVFAGGCAITALVVVATAYNTARERAESDFFMELAPALGLALTGGTYSPPFTPLLSAGGRRHFSHTMEGTLDGQAGGPLCAIGHYTYETYSRAEAGEAEVSRWTPHNFTACSTKVGSPVGRFRGIFVRPRLSGLGLDHDWLATDPRPVPVELESMRFNELSDLRRAANQEELAVRELLSPALIDFLAEHPLTPGFEYRTGQLVVFVPGHLDTAGKFTLLFEAAREIAAHVARQTRQPPPDPAVPASPHFSAAGQTIR